MHLVVDAQALQTPGSRHRGIGRYARNLLRELAACRPGWRIDAAVNSAFPPPDPGAVPASIGIRPFDPPLPMHPDTRPANELYFADWLATLQADVLLELSFFEDLALVPQFCGPRPPLVGIAYDLIPLLFHEQYLTDADAAALYGERLRQFAAADLMLAISEATRADVLRLLRWPPSRVVTILGAAEPHEERIADQAETAATLSRLGIGAPFLLYVGGFDWRKNVHGTLAAFACLPASVRASHLLVIVCSLTPPQEAQIRSEAARLGVQDRLRLTNFVDDVALQVLYRACRLSLFPSYYEGLGLPVIEALMSGAPVVASNRSAIPEFAGPLSRIASPSSPEDLAAAIEATLREPRELRIDDRKRFASAFTWADTAMRAAEAIERSALVTRPSLRPRPPRVAWVSPLPPARSGIADYSQELLDRLPGEFEIELVVSPEATTAFELARRFRVVRSDEVAARHAECPFDLFVYHVGNSEFHLYMLDLMVRYAGLTVLHDLYLGGLALRASAVGAWPGDLAADLDEEGARELAGAARKGEPDHDRIAREVPLHRRLVAASEAVVVHSAWSRSRLDGAEGIPVFRIPAGIRRPPVDTPEASRTLLGLAADRFLVVTLGEVTPSKRIGSIVDAARMLPARIRERLELVVVGETPAAQASALHARAEASGVRLRITGRVPLDALSVYARAADACVQLRYPSGGETSAAMLRALAAGAACIVSDGGSFAEVDGDAAIQVRTPAHEVEDVAAALARLHDDRDFQASLRARATRFVEEQHDLDAAARHYAAAMHLTIARRARLDGEWRDAVSTALAGAEARFRVDETIFDRWSELRSQRRRLDLAAAARASGAR